MPKRASKKAKKKAPKKKKPAVRKTAKKKAAKPKKKTAKAGARGKKRPAARKAVSKRPAPKKAATAVSKPVPKPKVILPAAPPSATPFPAANEQRVGTIVHYYSHLGVAVVRMERGEILVGDTIHVQGHTSNFRQRIESMEVEHEKIPRAVVGQEFGLKVIEHAREHDAVFRVG